MSAPLPRPTRPRLADDRRPLVPRRLDGGRRQRRAAGPQEARHRQGQAVHATWSCSPIAILFVAPFAWLISASFQPIEHDLPEPAHLDPRRPDPRRLQGLPQRRRAHRGRSRARGSGDWRWFAQQRVRRDHDHGAADLLQRAVRLLLRQAEVPRPRRDLPALPRHHDGARAGAADPELHHHPAHPVLRRQRLDGQRRRTGWLDSYCGPDPAAASSAPSASSCSGSTCCRSPTSCSTRRGSTAPASSGSSGASCCRCARRPWRPTRSSRSRRAWEDFFWPLIIMSDPDKYTAPVGLALFVVQNRTSWNLLFAGSVIATLPMIIVFIIFQRHFVQGIALTGVKG